jgi:hypothetical protein
MNRQAFIRFTAFVLMAVASTSAQASIAVEFDLSAPIVTANTAQFEVRLHFAGDLGDQIEAYQLSVIGSDPQLTVGDTDFTRFSYTPVNSPAPLDVWTSSGTISFGTELGFPIDLFAGPFITPSATPLVLGILSVNLTGIAGSSLNVTLAGGPPGFETDVGGTFAGNPVFSVVGAADPDLPLTYSDPSGVSFATLSVPTGQVPEPTSLMSWAGLLILGGYVSHWQRTRKHAKQSAGSACQPGLAEGIQTS